MVQAAQALSSDEEDDIFHDAKSGHDEFTGEASMDTTNEMSSQQAAAGCGGYEERVQEVTRLVDQLCIPFG